MPEVQEEARALLARLTTRHRRAVEMRFGFGDGVDRTLGEVAKELGVSQQRACQVLAWALVRMRALAACGMGGVGPDHAGPSGR
ncbi:MAG: sigma factor-like helix-turn-helix DNA-binding protein [Gemmataceae bacterium]